MNIATMSRALLRAALLTIILVGNLPAGTTGKISGKITDAQTHEALPGVNVIVTGTSLGAASDINGTYFIINIPPGAYQVKASAVGYPPVVVNEVKVSADQTTKIDFQLQSQAVEVTGIVVEAKRPIVQKDLTSTTANVTSDQIAALPVEDVGALVNLQAGVVEGHFRGGRDGEVKYLVDGISVNDVFSGTSTLQPEVNTVQEVQVLSGTFNAEYGEALSGVVNQVTKVGSDRLSGQITAYTGDYVTNRNGLFPNIDHVSPSDLRNVEASLSGPIDPAGKYGKFYASARYFYDDGYLYGRRKFNPQDSSNFSSDDPSKWHIGATGDGKYVPMNFQRRYSLQGKINMPVGNAKGLTLQVLYQNHDWAQYDHAYVLNPDGDYRYYQQSFLGSVNYNHVFSASSFIDISSAAFISDYKQYVYDNPTDRGYVSSIRVQGLGPNEFLTGGTQNWQFRHHTNTYTEKVDFTSQIDPVHQVKTGIEGVFHTLRYQDFQIHVDATSDFIPTVAKPGDFDYNFYKNDPYQLAFYLQDKIELDYLVINAGLRFDAFQPDGQYLLNADSIGRLDPLQPPYPSSLMGRASVKTQLSPRIGISYPITDQGAVHLSYGHFFQIPPFEYLYKNPNFRIPGTGSFPEFIGNIIGNANLQPQRTTMYEVGLQQELAANLGLTVTAYYKDIRDLLGVELHYKNGIRLFSEYINRDYGAVKGFTVAFDKRLASGFGATIDYTYQVAQGNASDPQTDLINAQSTPPVQSNKQLVPLDWDRRHSLNFSATVGNPTDLVGSFIGRLGSGLPYTPALVNQQTEIANSDNKPTFFNVDMYITKYLKIGALGYSVFLKVYNLFDTANELNVYTDTGRAGYTLLGGTAHNGVNTLSEYLSRPDFYSAPRQIVLGGTVSF